MNLLPRGPKGSNSWNEEDTGKNHAEPRSITVTPSQSDSDEDIERGIFQKINTVGEQRNGTDGPRDSKLHAEVGQIQQSDNYDDPAEVHALNAIRRAKGTDGSQMPRG